MSQLLYDILGCLQNSMRRLADGDIYKPYAIINDHTFAASENELRK